MFGRRERQTAGKYLQKTQQQKRRPQERGPPRPCQPRHAPIAASSHSTLALRRSLFGNRSPVGMVRGSSVHEPLKYEVAHIICVCEWPAPYPFDLFRAPRGLCVPLRPARCRRLFGCPRTPCLPGSGFGCYGMMACAVCSILGERRGRQGERGARQRGGELTDVRSDVSSRDHVHEAGAGPRQRSQLGSGAAALS